MAVVLTVTEAASVVAGVGFALTPRQIRYLALAPCARAEQSNGARLYGALDICLLATFAEVLVRCRALELPAWCARAAVRYLEADLRRAFQRRTPRFLVVDPIHGTAALSATNDTGGAVDLQALAAQVVPAVRARRLADPDVWMGSARVSMRDLGAFMR